MYYEHFRTNRQLVAQYPAISAYVRELYQVPGVAETVDFEPIKLHYYGCHESLNPTGFVPVGLQQDFTAAHGRERSTRRD